MQQINNNISCNNPRRSDQSFGMAWRIDPRNMTTKELKVTTKCVDAMAEEARKYDIFVSLIDQRDTHIFDVQVAKKQSWFRKLFFGQENYDPMVRYSHNIDSDSKEMEECFIGNVSSAIENYQSNSRAVSEENLRKAIKTANTTPKTKKNKQLLVN